MSTLGPRTALKSRKISGSLAYILAQTNVKQGTKAAPNDVAGCTLEMGADGKWVGTLGSLPKAAADALYASGALANLATGATYRDTSGTQYAYSNGAGWMLAGDIGPGSPSTPFATEAERTAWATANLSTLRSGVSTVWGPGAVEYVWNGPLATDWEPLGAIAINGLLRAATVGDSYATFGLGATDTEIMPLDFPESGTSEFSAGQNVFGGLYTIPGIMVACGGIAGQTTTQVLARGASAYSTSRRALQDVAAKNPHVVFIRGMSINDIMFYTSATSIALVDAVVTRTLQAIKYFTNRGISVVNCGIYGINNGSVVTLPAADLAAVRGFVLYINDKLKAASTTNPLHRFLDPAGVIHDGTGAIIAGLSNDGVHLNGAGSAALTRLEAPVLRSMYKPINWYNTVLWDEQGNYANQSGGNPANTTFSVGAGCTIASKTCVGDVHTMNVTVTDYTTAHVTKYWTAIVSQVLGSVALGKGLAFLFDYELRDSSGNLVMDVVTVSQVLLRNSDNTKAAKYDKGLGTLQNVPFIKQFSTPVDGASLGSNTSVFVMTQFPANGAYVLTFRPSCLIQYK